MPRTGEAYAPRGHGSGPGARLIQFFNRPYYVYRPSQLIRRVGRAVRADGGITRVGLPWGVDIEVDATESLGAAVVRNAVFEIGVSELIYRLCDPGELALDIGANVGYMTSIFAVRLSSGGEVIACEPHPMLFARLSRNADRWSANPQRLAQITVLQVALSDRDGKGKLFVPPEFEINMCIATLRESGAGDGIEVRLQRLDDVVPAGSSVGVAKLDVEGHEARVLAGGRKLIEERRIRDIVFEEHQGYPSETAALLERSGYTVFGVEQRLRGVVITAPELAAGADGRFPPTFVASCQPERVRSRMAPPGWQVLRDRSVRARSCDRA